jgi:hypothetical protein
VVVNAVEYADLEVVVLGLLEDVIVLAVRWYLRLDLSYRDVEELLACASRQGC